MFEIVITSLEEIVIHLVLVLKREVSTLESPVFVSFSVMFLHRAASGEVKIPFECLRER